MNNDAAQNWPAANWNYRLIRHDADPDPKQHSIALHEVFYEDDGRPCGWTADPTDFTCDGDENPSEIAAMLRMALQDVERYDVLSEAQLLKDTRAFRGTSDDIFPLPDGEKGPSLEEWEG